MGYNLKKFSGVNQKVENRITVTNSYTIGFPTRFSQNNQVASFKYAVLYFDADQLAVGVQFTNDEAELSKFTLLHSKQGHGSSLIARSFFKVNGIDPKQYKGRYEWEKVEQNEVTLYVIKLKRRPTDSVAQERSEERDG